MGTAHIQEDHVLQTLQRDIAFDGGVISLGTIPANSVIVEARLILANTFDGSGFNLSVGAASAHNSVFSDGTFNLQSLGLQTSLIGEFSPLTDTEIFADVTQGTATQGDGRVLVQYIQPPIIPS